MFTTSISEKDVTRNFNGKNDEKDDKEEKEDLGTHRESFEEEQKTAL
jgi:hypothetical protein